jgi:hypothetical protein
MRYEETRSRARTARGQAARRLATPLLAVLVGVAAAPAAAGAVQGDLIVTTYPPSVIRVDETGARTIVSDQGSPAQNDDFRLGEIIGVAIAPNGDIYVADSGAPGSRFGTSGGVWRIDPVTGLRTPVSSNADPVNPAALFSGPDGIAFEADGNLIVTDYAADGGDGAVFRVNPDTGERSVLSSNTAQPDDDEFATAEGVAIAPDRTIYVADSDAYDGDGGVFRVNPDTGQRTMISNNDSPTVGTVPDYQTPVAIAIDDDGDLLVAERMSEGDDEGAVIRVDPDTGTRSLISSNDAPVQDDDDLFANPAGIVVAPDDDIFVSRGVFSSPGFGAIQRVDPVTGERSLFSSFATPYLSGPWAIAVDSTPTLASSFRTANVPAAGPARLRMSVTGLRYALTGRDWSLTNALSAGLAVAPNPNVALSCEDRDGAATPPPAMDVTAPAGATAIDVVGHLNRADARCNVDVDVVAPGGPDSYVTGPANITARQGLEPPSITTSAARFHAAPVVTIDSPANGQTVDLGSPLAASFACSASAGVQTCNGTTANRGSLDTSTAGTFTYTATAVDVLGQVATKTTRYTVKAPATTNVQPRQPRTGAQLALACSGARIALLEVLQVGNRVRFKGVTSRSDAGRQVPIRLIGGERVVVARVGPDGLFEITSPLPKRSIRETEKARYVAHLGSSRSPSVKLTRRMTMDALTLTRTSVTIYGQVAKPLPKVKRDIVITERTRCGGPARVVATVRPNTLGNYRATFRRPGNVDSAIYRLRTRVRVDSGSRKATFRTYTLVRAVDLF